MKMFGLAGSLASFTYVNLEYWLILLFTNDSLFLAVVDSTRDSSGDLSGCFCSNKSFNTETGRAPVIILCRNHRIYSIKLFLDRYV